MIISRPMLTEDSQLLDDTAVVEETGSLDGENNEIEAKEAIEEITTTIQTTTSVLPIVADDVNSIIKEHDEDIVTLDHLAAEQSTLGPLIATPSFDVQQSPKKRRKGRKFTSKFNSGRNEFRHKFTADFNKFLF